MAKRKKIAIWEPQPRQEAALVRDEYEILYGGARGGGKTDAGIHWLRYPLESFVESWKKRSPLVSSLARYKALVIRRNVNDLSDWLDRAEYWYKKIYGNFVTFTGKPVEIKFFEGVDPAACPTIKTGHLKDEDAYQKYQGHEYQRQVIEELTQIADIRNYENLIMSCRSTIPEIQPQVFSTTNPDGPGFYWVKKRFSIPDYPGNNPIETVEDVKMPDGSVKQIRRVFVKSLLSDNRKLDEANPSYRVNLASMSDEAKKRAWLEGYWGEPIIEGVIYEKEMKQARFDGRIGEVPWDTTKPVYTYWDIGRDATPIWFVQFVGHAIHFIDFYEASNQDLAHFAQVLRSKPYWYGGHFGPHDLSHKNMAGASTWSLAQDFGIVFQTPLGKDSISDGIEMVKSKFSRFKFDANKCVEGIKRLSAYRREHDDEKNVFKDIPVHDWASHASDALRYMAMAPEPLEPGALDQNFNLYTTKYN